MIRTLGTISVMLTVRANTLLMTELVADYPASFICTRVFLTLTKGHTLATVKVT